MKVEDSINKAIEIQQECIGEYLKVYSSMKKGEAQLMKIAVIETQKEYDEGFHTYFPHTNAILEVWIDRANVQRVKNDLTGKEEIKDGWLF